MTTEQLLDTAIDALRNICAEESGSRGPSLGRRAKTNGCDCGQAGGRHELKRSRMFLFALVLCIISSTSAGDVRYVVVSKTIGLRFNRYPLWEPIVGNKIGKLNVGTEVELLDSAQCGEGLVGVRALSGTLKGETGCITGDAISSRPPTSDEIEQGEAGPDYVHER
jgi:hypothetical protein